MKKFLLPIAALMLGGAASAQTSQQVTVQYWAEGETYNLTVEVCEPTTNELITNEDGSFTLKNFQNSSYDFTFSIGTRIFSSGKAESYPEGVYGSPILETSAPSYPTDGSGANYKYKLQTKEGLVKPAMWGAASVEIPYEEITGNVYINKNYSVAVKLSETDKETKYKVYVNSSLIIPKIIDIMPYAWSTGGYTIFEMTVPKEGGDQSGDEGEYTFTYNNQPQFNSNTYFATEKYKIKVVDDKNIIVDNFLGTGSEVGIQFTEPTAVSGQDYYAQGQFTIPSQYVHYDLGGRVTLKNPDGGEDGAAANLPNGVVIPAVSVYLTSNAYVRYYNEDGKVRRHIYSTIGNSNTGWYTVEWDMIEGENGDQSGIADVVVDENAPVEWYNLQGVRVNGDNLAPGIYIKRHGSKAVKVLVK